MNELTFNNALGTKVSSLSSNMAKTIKSNYMPWIARRLSLVCVFSIFLSFLLFIYCDSLRLFVFFFWSLQNVNATRTTITEMSTYTCWTKNRSGRVHKFSFSGGTMSRSQSLMPVIGVYELCSADFGSIEY